MSKTFIIFKVMGSKNRSDVRFDDIGRIESDEICPLAGTLDNISLNGCKVHYQYPVVIDLDNDYSVKLTFARAVTEGSLSLLCHPQWVKEENGCTFIGFKFLPSKDFSRLNGYIKKLNLETNNEEIKIELDDSDSTCELI